MSGKLDFLICAKSIDGAARLGYIYIYTYIHTYIYIYICAYRVYTHAMATLNIAEPSARAVQPTVSGGIDHRIPAWASRQHARELESIGTGIRMYVCIHRGSKMTVIPEIFAKKKEPVTEVCLLFEANRSENVEGNFSRKQRTRDYEI